MAARPGLAPDGREGGRRPGLLRLRRRAAGFLGPSGVGPGRVSGDSEGGRSGYLSPLRAGVLSGVSVSNPASFLPEPPRWRPWSPEGVGSPHSLAPSLTTPRAISVSASAREPGVPAPPGPRVPGLGVSPLPQPRASGYSRQLGSGTPAARRWSRGCDCAPNPAGVRSLWL